MYSDLWACLEERLNFTTEITKLVCEDCSKFTAMKNAVANNEYDMALTGNSLICIFKVRNFRLFISYCPDITKNILC